MSSKEYELQIINNLHNVTEGMVLKNYKELCKVFGLKVKTSNAKKSQLKEMERFVKLEKNGHNYIILDVYKEPLQLVDGRLYSKKVANYIEELELLLLDLMCKTDGKYLDISKSKLKEALSMVNFNYNHYYSSENRGKLANDLAVDMRMINEYYQKSNDILNKALDTVFNRLENKRLILKLEKVMLVKLEWLDENTSRQYTTEATDDDRLLILAIEREALLDLNMNIDSKYNEIIASGNYHKFNNRVNELLLERMNVKYYYKLLHLGFNKEHVEYEREYLLSKSKENNLRNSVNGKLFERLGNQSINDYNRALQFISEYLDTTVESSNYFDQESIEFIPNTKHKLKLVDGYLNNMSKINNKLIPLKLNIED